MESYVGLSRVGNWQNLKIFSKNEQPYYLRNVVFEELFWDDPLMSTPMEISQTIGCDNTFESQTQNFTTIKDFLAWEKIRKFTKLSVKFPELDKFFDCQVTYLWPFDMKLQLTFKETDRFFFRFLQKKHETDLRYLKDFTMIKPENSMDTKD